MVVAECHLRLRCGLPVRLRRQHAEGHGEEEAAHEHEGEEADLAQLTLTEEDRLAVAARLAELPAVSEQEFYALSTRLEVIDIAIEAIRARRMAAGEQVDVLLRPEDYDRND